jgi:hypothetical protein
MENPLASKGSDARSSSSAIVIAAVGRSLCCTSRRMLFSGGRGRAARSPRDLTAFIGAAILNELRAADAQVSARYQLIGTSPGADRRNPKAPQFCRQQASSCSDCRVPTCLRRSLGFSSISPTWSQIDAAS